MGDDREQSLSEIFLCEDLTFMEWEDCHALFIIIKNQLTISVEI